jgi:hypothetical protein
MTGLDGTDAADPMNGEPIRCTLEMDGNGTVTVIRSAGCTPVDAYDLCVLVARGAGVIDRTPSPTRPDVRYPDVRQG